MALIEYNFLPGIDKQDTTAGAENRWIDSDNVRFRYGLPEKVGGWSSLISDSIVGVARKQHGFVDLNGNRYVAIGTDKFLLLYFEGQLFDITPLKSTISSSTIATVNNDPVCTITTSTSHNLEPGDIVLLDSVTLPSGTGFSASDFEDKLFQVTSVPTPTTFTITQSSNAGATVSTGGSIAVKPYEKVGPAAQSYGYGFGISQWNGLVSGAATSTLNGSLSANSAGTGGVGTNVTLAATTNFSAAGRILVEEELISYASISSPNLQSIVRNVDGTSNASHNTGTAVTDATNFSDWGEAVLASEVTLEPGLWSLDNFGQVLIATIANGKTFTWNAGAASPLTVRASTTTSNFATGNNPTASRLTLVSPTTRHLCHFGTETTIGDTTTQDDMFIRFSDQEDINTYAPTATNTAGTQRLADGSQIRGAIRGRDAIYVWTDTALFTQRFVGQPFTFAFSQVGTNCGLAGQNACVEVDGAAYWMSENGFFRYAGKLESLPCLVEDHVYNDINIDSGNQMISAGLNNLFGEVMWFYPTSSSSVVNRMVSYNYFDSSPQRPVWTVGTLARTMWQDSAVFGSPHATEYDAATDTSFDVVGNTEGRTSYYEHEVGVDQNRNGTITAIPANITSGDFDITQQRASATGQSTGVATFRGDGEFIMKIRRFIPDFISQTGTTRITLQLRDFPNDTQASSSLGPFDITSSTKKVDTRARARAIALKVENTAVNQSWKLGTFRLDIQPDGRR